MNYVLMGYPEETSFLQWRAGCHDTGLCMLYQCWAPPGGLDYCA